MTDYFLRFDTHTAALLVFLDLDMTYVDDEGVGHISQGTHQYALDEFGEIPGKEGYHINLRVIDPEFDVSAMEPYQVFPQQPVRIWA